MAGYNRTRFVEELLEKTESQPPSFTVHLHSEYWVLNNGSKFLYHNQIASLLDDIRAHRIPVDLLELFDAARVPFYDGCMVVELLDYRPQNNKEPLPEKPEKTRVILHPNPETLWADICSLNKKHGGKWNDNDAIEIEAKLLLATSSPLCLDPDPHLTRIVNHVIKVSTPPAPVSLKRKASSIDNEEDEAEKARKAKIMAFMSTRQNRTVTPSYRLLETMQNMKKMKAEEPQPELTTLPGHPFMSDAPQQPNPQQNGQTQHAQNPLPVESSDMQGTPVVKSDTPTQSFANVAFTRTNGSHTPIPPQPSHQFILQNPSVHHPSPPNVNSPAQTQALVNAPADQSKRTPTPAQSQQHHTPQHTQQPLPNQQQNPAQAQPSPYYRNNIQSPKAPLQAINHAPPQPTNQPQPSTATAFQAPVPNHFILPPVRSMTTQPGVANANPSQQLNSQQISNPQLTQAQAQAQAQAQHAHMMLYSQQLAQSQQQLQQQLFIQQKHNAQPKNGRSTPQNTAKKATPSPARSSPVVANQTPARSPMPLNAQQLPSQMTHPHPHPQMLYNAAHLRPMIHNPSQAAMVAQMANSPNSNAGGGPHTATPSPAPTVDGQRPQSQPQAPPQQQLQPPMHAHPPPQHHPYSQMYGYPQINYPIPPGRLPPAYWQMSGMGRGIPGIVNGQHMGLPPNAQQVGKQPVPGGMPGR